MTKFSTTYGSSIPRAGLRAALRAAGYTEAQSDQVELACDNDSPPHRFTRAEVDSFIAAHLAPLWGRHLKDRFGYIHSRMKIGDAFPSNDMIYAAMRATTPPLYPPK